MCLIASLISGEKEALETYTDMILSNHLEAKQSFGVFNRLSFLLESVPLASPRNECRLVEVALPFFLNRPSRPLAGCLSKLCALNFCSISLCLFLEIAPVLSISFCVRSFIVRSNCSSRVLTFALSCNKSMGFDHASMLKGTFEVVFMFMITEEKLD